MLADLIAALREPRTYLPHRNPWALFGLLWGLPVPLFSLFLHWWACRDAAQVAAAWRIHSVFLLHPVLFMILFGAMGTLQMRKDEALVGAMQELERVASTDGLTGLQNYRSLCGRLVAEMERARRSGEPLACLMLDLDNFKQINDAHGHLAGDDLLRQAARRLDAARREYDVLARYGGDEFVFVLPGTARGSALTFARRLYEEAAQEGFLVEGVPGMVRVTMSVGLAMFPEEGGTWTQLLREADRAMYEAKTHGRNCVATADGRIYRDGEPEPRDAELTPATRRGSRSGS